MGLVFPDSLRRISSSVLLCLLLSLLCVCMCLRNVVVQALGALCSMLFDR
jgi:hypothetical protein